MNCIDHVAGSLPHSLAINPLSPSECQQSFGAYNPNSAVCGRAQGNPCDVDNGSALVCTRGNGRYLLKGIYSGETGCGPNQIMTFTKMDVDFIRGGKGSAQKSLPINPINSRNTLNSVPQTPFFAQQKDLTRTTYSYPTPIPQANTIQNYVVPSTQLPGGGYLPPSK